MANTGGLFALVLLGGSIFTDSFYVCFSGSLVRLAKPTAHCEHLTSLLEVGAQFARLRGLVQGEIAMAHVVDVPLPLRID